MKKIIRIKIKHLLGGIGVFLSLLLLVYIFLPSIMLSIGQRYQNQGNIAAARMYYDKMDRFFPSHTETAQALERTAQIISTNNLLMVSTTGVGSGFSSNHSIISKEAQLYYEKLVERFPDTFQGRNARTQLTIQEIKNKISQNKIEDAFVIMQDYYNIVNSHPNILNANSSVVLEAVISLKAKGLPEEGLKFMDFYLAKYNTEDTRLYEATGDLYAFLGQEEEAMSYYAKVLDEYAMSYYAKVLDEYNEIIEIESQYIDMDMASSTKSYYIIQKEALLRKIDAISDGVLKHGSLTGNISLRNEAYQGVHVFLQPQREPGISIMGSIIGESIWSISDEDGSFSFDYLEPGRYTLGFILDLEEVGDVVLKGGFFPQSTIIIAEDEISHWDFQLVDTIAVKAPLDNEKIIDDKVHFKWEAFEDAAYYTLELGSYSIDGGGASFTTYTGKKFYTNEAVLTVEELTYTPRGMMFTDDGPDPGSFFGFANPHGRYFWGVLAHDEKGNVLTASRGYLKGQNTDFHFEDRPMRRGDNFILQRRFGEAIKAFEKDLSNNSEDVYALSMLGKLYGLSYRNYDNYPYVDLDKAVAYYERVYEITNDVSFLNNLIDIVYREQRDYDKVLDIFEILEENNVLYPWHKNQLSMIYSHQGNYEKALEKLLEVDETYHQLETALRILTNNFEGLSLSLGDLPETKWLDALKEYEEKYSSMDADLKEIIMAKPALEALALLADRDLTPHEALLQLLLKMVEPSISIHDYEEVGNYMKKYQTEDSTLSKIVKDLFIVVM